MVSSRTEIDRLEQLLLASAAQDKKVYFFLAARMKDEEFTVPSHRRLWQQARKAQDPAKLEPFASHDVTPLTVTKVSVVLGKLREATAVQKVKHLCLKAIKVLENGELEQPERFLNQFARAAAKISVVRRNDEVVLSPEDWLERGLNEITDRQASGPRHLDLGLPKTSVMVAAEPGHLVILSADTGKGKTALALNMAAHLGMVSKIPTLYLNTEMAWWELAFRLYALLADADLFRMRCGRLDTADLARVTEVSRWAGGALYITDAVPWMTADEVVSLAREHAVTVGLKVLVLDYVQRMENQTGDERWETFLAAAKTFKSLAQELGILFLLVAQMRDGHLAESRGMKREADVVLELSEENDKHVLRLRKSRHTTAGTKIDLAFDRRTLRLTEIDSAGTEPSAFADPGAVPETVRNLNLNLLDEQQNPAKGAD